MAQLKMYWFTDSPLEELNLPEGYSFSHFSEETRENDIKIWNDASSIDPMDPADYEARFKREIYDFVDIVPERDVWFLDHNGKHVGTSSSFIWGNTGYGDMHWVGIIPEYRGKGLAKYLSYIVQKTLKERGCPFVSLTTDEFRPAAVRSYLKAGFVPVEYDEGMVERWEKVLEFNGIDSVQMVYEDGSPYKIIYRTGLKK